MFHEILSVGLIALTVGLIALTHRGKGGLLTRWKNPPFRGVSTVNAQRALEKTKSVELFQRLPVKHHPCCEGSA